MKWRFFLTFSILLSMSVHRSILFRLIQNNPDYGQKHRYYFQALKSPSPIIAVSVIVSSSVHLDDCRVLVTLFLQYSDPAWRIVDAQGLAQSTTSSYFRNPRLDFLPISFQVALPVHHLRRLVS